MKERGKVGRRVNGKKDRRGSRRKLRQGKKEEVSGKGKRKKRRK